MPIRRRHYIGENLIEDESTGIAVRSSKITRTWDGFLVHRENRETRHPQEYVEPGTDPHQVIPIYPREALASAAVSASETIGVTGISARQTGPGWHIYT